MRFALTAEQQDFAASLESLLASSDTVGVARSWAAGDVGPGLKLWSRLADQAVPALLVPEERGGAGATPVELVVALEALGRHAVPGPWAETAAYLATALAGSGAVEPLAAGTVATVAVPPEVPWALDAGASERVYVVTEGALRAGTTGEPRASVDRTRRLHPVRAGAAVEPVPGPGVLAAAFDHAVLAVAAQLLGCGERLLADAVNYVKQRKQFGREIGSYQAVKHRLADVRIALDFARPLVYGAALAVADGTPRERERDVSAAKVACADAAYLAARTALQVHGAVGYTQELDLSLWILKVRALVSAWGTSAFHRGRVLAAVAEGA